MKPRRNRSARNILRRTRVAILPRRLAADTAGVAAAIPTRPSLAQLLAGHILRDGELVLLILRPSLWFVVLSSLWFNAGALILLSVARILTLQHPGQFRGWAELGVSLICARLMYATLQWTGRLYILTDMRILSLSGVYYIDVFDCPLRKVATARIVRTTPERLTAVGSIEIIPTDSDSRAGYWITIDRPREIHEQVIATISRAKQGAMGCD